jgi:YidC/Oxa1 family membrane protein insertase
MNKNSDSQKRILLATLIAFAFFIAYDFLYVQPKMQQEEEARKAAETKTEQQVQNTQNAAPTDAAPTMKQNTAPTTASSPAPATKKVSQNDIVSTITTKNIIFEIDSLGRIAQATLLKSQYIDEKGKHIQLFNAGQLRALEVRFSDGALNELAFKNRVSVSSAKIDAADTIQKLTITQKLGENTLTKLLTFYPDGHYDLDVKTAKKTDFYITPGYRPDVLADMYSNQGALFALNDGTTSMIVDGDLDKTESVTGVTIASSFDRYYTTLFYNFKNSMALSIMPDNDDNPQLFVFGSGELKVHGFMGPKDYEELNALNPHLTEAIEYGWATFLAKPMFLALMYIHDIVGNWGWSIVIITILIKIILFPLSYKGMMGMQKLKDLAPKIKEIQEKYKGDQQKMSAHMMELYKKHGANPMGGCLPILLQIPVFFAIYRVLLNAIELKGAPWILWITDLAEMDPYFILPIAMGATMFVHQLITPTTIQDEMQKKMFQLLPIVFTFFFLWFPAGLTLYWFVNNLVSIAQQYYMNKMFEKQKALKKEAHK